MSKRNSAEVWEFFKRNGDEAFCTKCPHKVTCKGSTTTPMLNHLKLKHKLDLTSTRSKDCSSSSKKMYPNNNPNILNFMKRQQLNEIVARLVSEDGFTVNAITKSSFIRQSISDKGYNLPKNPSKVMDLVISYFREQKATIIENISKKLNSGERFGLTLDEWTSLATKRYFNINIHCNESVIFNLGLVRIIGSCDAIETQKIVNQHLKEFGVIFEKHIVASTTDGASVMCKFGRESPVHHVQCMNHAIHLAVIDIFYNSSEKQDFREEICDDEISSELSELESDDNSNEFENGELVFENYEENHRIILQPNYNKAIKEVRNVVDFFRRSPTKNSILQRYVKEKFKKEIGLIRDIKTRWNSLEAMIERFIMLYSCIKISLIELNAIEKVQENNLVILKDMLDVLSPLKAAVEALSRKDATLLSCETIVLFLINKLTERNSALSLNFKEVLLKRISQRRHKPMVSLLMFLHNFSSSKENTWFPYSQRNITLTYAKELMKRLFPKEETAQRSTDEEHAETLCIHDEPELETTTLSVSDELNLKIQKSKNSVIAINGDDFNSFKKEFQLYEATGIRSKNMDLLYNALLSVKPTSTESERVFSTSGIVVSKLRTRLKDESVNAIVFLKSLFQSQLLNDK